MTGKTDLLASLDVLGDLDLAHAPGTDGLPESPCARWSRDGGATPGLDRAGGRQMRRGHRLSGCRSRTFNRGRLSSGHVEAVPLVMGLLVCSCGRRAFLGAVAGRVTTGRGRTGRVAGGVQLAMSYAVERSLVGRRPAVMGARSRDGGMM